MYCSNFSWITDSENFIRFFVQPGSTPKILISLLKRANRTSLGKLNTVRTETEVSLVAELEDFMRFFVTPRWRLENSNLILEIEKLILIWKTESSINFFFCH